MNEVLGNPSLLLGIFDFLNPRNECGSKKDLFSACLTCKDFLPPALDVLWRDLWIKQHPTMIIRSIPCIKARPISPLSSFKEWYIDTPLVDADLKRMKEYTRRVRTVHFALMYENKPDSTDTIHPSLFIRIALLLKGKPLFRNINRLCLSGFTFRPNTMFGAIDISLYLPHLSSPHLKYLSVAICGPSGEVSLDVIGFISDLGQASDQQPHLTRLEYSYSPPSAPLIQAMSNLRFLEHLDLKAHISDISFIRTLTSLQRLKFLTLTLSDKFTIPRHADTHSGIGIAAFPCLESLTLESQLCAPSDLNRLFSLTAIPLLHSLTLNLEEKNVTSQWKQHLSVFADHFPGLQSFTMASCRSEGDTSTLAWSECDALLRLHHLTRLSIQQPSIKLLKNEDVTEMVNAWPKLQSLAVVVRDMSSDLDRLDHTTLVNIATGLPDLVDLMLPIFLSHHLPSESRVTCSYTVSKLQNLTLSGGVSTYPPRSSMLPNSLDYPAIRRVARFLNVFFPHISPKTIKIQSYSKAELQTLLLLQEFMRCIAE